MNVFLYFCKRAVIYLVTFFIISSLVNLAFLSEFLETPKLRDKTKFYVTSATEETHKLAVEGNYLGLAIQNFKEQFSGALGGAIAVASLTTWTYRKKQKDLEEIGRK